MFHYAIVGYLKMLRMMNDYYADMELLTNITYHAKTRQLREIVCKKFQFFYWIIFLILVLGTSNGNINIVHLSNKHTEANLICCPLRSLCPAKENNISFEENFFI